MSSLIPVVFPTCLGPIIKFKEKGSKEIRLIQSGIHLSSLIPSNHAFWVKVVQYCAPPFSRVYSNDPLTRLLFEEEGIPVHSIPFFDREKLQGTFIRRLIAEGNPLWESLVPDPVKNIIKEIGGEKRLRKIFEIQKQ